MAGIDTYRKGIRSAIRGLWTGALDKDQFTDTMRQTINRRLMQAWLEGAAECGITEEDLTDKEYRALGEAVKNELGYVGNLAGDIVDANKKSGGKLEPLFIRAEMWVNRYNDIRNQSKVMACGDQKLMWQYGDTEHCTDCLRYNGKVYRASTWEKYGIRPQHRDLACHGYNCHCSLNITTAKVNKGRPPAMTGG